MATKQLNSDRSEAKAQAASTGAEIDFDDLSRAVQSVIRDALNPPQPPSYEELSESFPVVVRWIRQLERKATLEENQANYLIRRYLASMAERLITEEFSTSLNEAFDPEALRIPIRHFRSTAFSVWSALEERARKEG